MLKQLTFPGLAIAIAASTLTISVTSADRARDLGIEPGVFPTGPLNALTDVAGVRVGHTTIVEGDDIRTGVTAILPHGIVKLPTSARFSPWALSARVSVSRHT